MPKVLGLRDLMLEVQRGLVGWGGAGREGQLVAGLGARLGRGGARLGRGGAGRGGAGHCAL